MRVEAVRRCDMLDLTWAQITESLMYIDVFQQMQAGKPLTPDQEMELEKLSEGVAGDE